MKIRKNTYLKLLNSYSPLVPPEEGGILGARNGVICEYEHDCSEQTSNVAVYEPNAEFLNSIISKWEKENIVFAGMVHSHMPNETQLSDSDKKYAQEILKAMPKEIQKLYFPIVLRGKELIVYSICNNSVALKMKKENIEIV